MGSPSWVSTSFRVTGHPSTHTCRPAQSLRCEAEVKGYREDEKLTCARALSELEKIAQAGTDAFDPGQKRLLVWLNDHIRQLSAFFTQPF